MEIQSIKNRFGIIGNSPALNFALQVAAQSGRYGSDRTDQWRERRWKEAFSMIISCAVRAKTIILLLQ